MRSLAAAAAFWLAGPAWAGGPGTRGAEVLKFTAGPRAAGMGGAHAAAVDDVFALGINPAGLGAIEFPEASFVYNDWVSGVSQQTVAGAYPHPRLGGFAAGLTRLSVGDFAGYDASGLRVADVDAESLVVSAGWGRVFEGFAAGLAVKRVSERLERVSASALAADAGVQTGWDAEGWRLKAALALLNFGQALEHDRGRSALPTSLRGGVAATREFYGDPLTLAVDVARPSDDDRLQFAFGVEGRVAGLVMLRAGYQSPLDAGRGLSLGLGLKAKRLRFDYSVLPLGDFGLTHRVGLTVRWGEPVEISRDRDASVRAASHKARARELAAQGRHLEAMEQYQKAIDLDPLDKEAVREMRKSFDAHQKGR